MMDEVRAYDFDMPPIAHLSIHDVAPHTLEAVGETLETLRGLGVERALLLVIPGLPWTAGDLAQLKAWAGAGHPLAGHGWSHHVEHRRGLWHKLHGVLISRHVAEHLALDGEEIAALIRRNHAWFAAQGLPAPTHYVPPAWAMGSISRRRLGDLPFETYETLTGVYDRRSGVFTRLPLMGFEADTAFRALAVRLFNAWNRSGPAGRGPMRLALHPHDLELRLRDDLTRRCREYDIRAESPTGRDG